MSTEYVLQVPSGHGTHVRVDVAPTVDYLKATIKRGVAGIDFRMGWRILKLETTATLIEEKKR